MQHSIHQTDSLNFIETLYPHDRPLTSTSRKNEKLALVTPALTYLPYTIAGPYFSLIPATTTSPASYRLMLFRSSVTGK